MCALKIKQRSSKKIPHRKKHEKLLFIFGIWYSPQFILNEDKAGLENGCLKYEPSVVESFSNSSIMLECSQMPNDLFFFCVFYNSLYY